MNKLDKCLVCFNRCFHIDIKDLSLNAVFYALIRLLVFYTGKLIFFCTFLKKMQYKSLHFAFCFPIAKFTGCTVDVFIIIDEGSVVANNKLNGGHAGRSKWYSYSRCSLGLHDMMACSLVMIISPHFYGKP